MNAFADTTSTEGSQGPVTVRDLAYGDLPGVLSVERRAFVTPWSMAMFVLELSKPGGILLAAEDMRGLQGYLVCSRYAELWHLMNVAVDPDRRREGIASALMDGLFGQIPEGDRLMLEVRTSNDGAIRMYEKYGFVPAGHRHRYYQDNGEDAVVMERRR